MTRNQDPMTEEQIKDAKAAIHDLFAEVREDLAEDLGGDPDDYRADRAATDGGE